MGVSIKELIEREFECVVCRHKMSIEVKKGTRAIRNFHCIECECTRQYFATDTLKRVDEEKDE